MDRPAVAQYRIFARCPWIYGAVTINIFYFDDPWAGKISLLVCVSVRQYSVLVIVD